MKYLNNFQKSLPSIKDKRLAFSVILMPGLMIYLIYSLMGNMMTEFIGQ